MDIPELPRSEYDDQLAQQKQQEAASLAASAQAAQQQEKALQDAINRALNQLVITGPGVSGSARTGWAINSAGGAGSGTGTLTTFRAVKVVSGTPSAATFQIEATEV